ncbi:DUF6240 domain-containing protein [Clostridiaceae bacterium 35-E11]
MKIDYANFQLQQLEKSYVDFTNLKVGQYIKARVHKLMNDIIMLEMGDGKILEAKTNASVNLGSNEVVYFEIKEVNGNQVIIKPITQTKKPIDTAYKNITGVLEKFNIQPSKENIELVKRLIQHQIPVTKKNILQIQQSQWNFKTLETMLNVKSINLNSQNVHQDIGEVLKELLHSEKNHFNQEVNMVNEENINSALNMRPKIDQPLINIQNMNIEKLIFLLKNDLKLNINNATNLNNILLKEYDIAKQVEDLTVLLQSDKETMKLGESVETALVKLQHMILDKKFVPHELIKELYIKLEFIKQAVEDMQIKEGKKILNLTISLKDSLDFMSKLNQAQTYFQLPILLNNKHKNIELFIAKDRKNKKRINPKDITILIALDTKNMDKVSVLLEIKDRTIICSFQVIAEKIKKSLVEQEKILKDTLLRLGFSNVSIKYRISSAEENIFNIEDTKELMKVNFIDVRV